MSGYPYDTRSSFIRDPARYGHDVFGHVGTDDAALGRKACMRKIPHTGIDISPKVSGDRNAKVLSPVYGTIVATGFDKEAGAWLIIKAYGLAEWWVGGHNSRFVKRSGNVERGEHVAYMGMTGNVTGVHVHWSVATSEAAAWDQINGYINYKNGRTSTAWGASEGLVDPWPLFEREWAAHERHLADVAKAEAAYLAAVQARKEAEARAAAAAAIEKARREAIMSKTVLLRRNTTGAVALVNVGERLIKHVPNTAALPGAKAVADSPEVIDLDDASFAFALEAAANGTVAEKVLAARDALLK